MGCLCSKGSIVNDYVAEYEKEKEKEQSKSSVKVIDPSNREEVILGVDKNLNNDSSLHSRPKSTLETNKVSAPPVIVEENAKTIIIERPKSGHRRHSTMDLGGVNGTQQTMSRIVSMPRGAKGEQVAAGWPSWLASVAGDAIKGWSPRSADSYEKLNKVGTSSISSFIVFSFPSIWYTHFKKMCILNYADWSGNL